MTPASYRKLYPLIVEKFITIELNAQVRNNKLMSGWMPGSLLEIYFSHADNGDIITGCNERIPISVIKKITFTKR